MERVYTVLQYSEMFMLSENPSFPAGCLPAWYQDEKQQNRFYEFPAPESGLNNLENLGVG